MEMQENLAEVIRLIMEKRHMSLQEFSEELEISRTMLYEYLRGKGNPSIKTVAHLAEKLDLNPVFLLTGMLGLDQKEVVLLLLDTIRSVAELPEERRVRFAELFLEMLELWDET